MSEWYVDIQSMIPMGQIGERMVVLRREHMSDRVSIMVAPTLKEIDPGVYIADNEVFMTSHTGSSDRFGKGEIDQFLLAMMEAGWRRGLRPKAFDPSAGELAAVNRHLEDMRKVAMARGGAINSVDSMHAIAQQAASNQSLYSPAQKAYEARSANIEQKEAGSSGISDIGTDTNKSW